MTPSSSSPTGTSATARTPGRRRPRWSASSAPARSAATTSSRASASPASGLLRYSGGHSADGRGVRDNKLFDVNIPVGPATRLSLQDLPRVHRPGPRVPVDLRGRRPALHRRHLPEPTSAPIDQHGVAADARAARVRRKMLYADQWNAVAVRRSATVAAGKTIDRILSATTTPTRRPDPFPRLDRRRLRGGRRRRPSTRASPTNYVDTRRGTNSIGLASRAATTCRSSRAATASTSSRR